MTADGREHAEVGRWRKKPVVIEAMRVTALSEASVAEWCGGRSTGAGVLIQTLEGTMRADWGDYVIRGVQGEFYPCKPDIFVATYEPEEPAHNARGNR